MIGSDLAESTPECQFLIKKKKTPKDRLADEQVWQIVNTIPQGKVATYGQVAALAGFPQNARLVGRILSRLPNGTRLPWHRVVNSAGKISNPNPDRQLDRLKKEGVTPINGRISLKLYRWVP